MTGTGGRAAVRNFSVVAMGSRPLGFQEDGSNGPAEP